MLSPGHRRPSLHAARFIAFFTALMLLTLSACSDKKAEEPSAAPIDTIPMLVTQIQKCAKLYTAEYQVHKIVTHEDQMKLQGSFMSQKFDITLPVGERRIAIPMDATLKASVDFSSFSAQNVKRKGDRIEITLPDPKVELTSSKINHEEIKKQVPLLRGKFTDEEMAKYEKQGRAAILNDVPRMGIITMARENAANTLIPMLVMMGFQEQNVTVTFRKQFSANDLPRLLDSNYLRK